MSDLIEELKRRNVIRVAIAYAVTAWLFIQIAETIFPLFGFDDAPARIVVVVLLIGFPLALVLSWIYELTPEGLMLERDVDRSSSITRDTGKRLDRGIIFVLVLAVGYFAIDKFVLDPARDIELQRSVEERVRDEVIVQAYVDRSIAVLAFENMSGDPNNEYFSDGISEEVLNLLARYSELRVISRSSSFSYKNKEIPIPEIADELRVSHILEGSVRKVGNTVRITAQLIEARTDRHLWSETYDRELTDIFAVQDEIAATVVERLTETLLDPGTSSFFGSATRQSPASLPTDARAYELFLQARFESRKQSAAGLEDAERLYKESLEIDGEYVPAWIGLSAVFSNMVSASLLPLEEGGEAARNAIEKALEIDPESAAALDSMGWLVLDQENDIRKAAAYVTRALEIDPGAIDAMATAARILQDLGRLDESLQLQQFTVARDPLNPVRHNNLGALQIYMRDYAGARSSMLRILEISPDYLGAQFFVGLTDLLMGDAETALESFELEEDESWRLKGLALANFALGRKDAANAALNEFIENWGDMWPNDVAHIYAYWGDADRAFEWIEMGMENDGGWGEEKLNPLNDNLRNDPRWQEFLEAVGATDPQLAEIEFDVPLPII